MSAILQCVHAAAQKRRIAIVLAVSTPCLLALCALAWRFGNAAIAIGLLVAGAVAIAAAAWRLAAAMDRRWLVRTLDAQRADLEDSGDLLFADEGRMNPLQRLQLARMCQRLDEVAAPDLRPPWPTRALAIGILLAAATIATTALWPASPVAPQSAAPPQVGSNDTAATRTRLVQQWLEIEPPAYTRLPKSNSGELDAKIPEGARLRWRLRFDPAPVSAELVFLDGRRLPLQRDGEDWSVDATFDKAGLYRIVSTNALPLVPDRLHRIDVIGDQPPQIRVTAPDQNLSLRGSSQRQWSLRFEASDDYGINGNAQLRIITARGTGEIITFGEHTRVIAGRGEAMRKRYAYRLDLDALALAQGDDLIVQFTVRDNRAGRPQSTRSASYILRWPLPQSTTDTGLDGLVKDALPAYFRSQRQIIIDAEALIPQKPKLGGDEYVQRSDAIGVDQRLLRLRYGQFLGEESEGAPQRPLMPTNDAEDEAARQAERNAANFAPHLEPLADDAPEDHDQDAETTAASAASAASDPHDGHNHGVTPAETATQGFGEAGNVLEEYGHMHDLPEAATLLDPETRTTLRAALDQMWQSELNLRLGKPDAALPFAYKALDFIKQVQQASRIYLARVGYEQAQVDETRRLSGKREGLASRRDALVAASGGDPETAALWMALQDVPVEDRGPAADVERNATLDAFEAWLRRNETRIADPLALVAALDALRREPDCLACRRQLRTLLWPLLTPPAAAPAPRRAADRTGQVYLDALQRGDAR